MNFIDHDVFWIGKRLIAFTESSRLARNFTTNIMFHDVDFFVVVSDL